MMTLERFLLYAGYLTRRPQGVSARRWKALFRWLQVRETLGEDITLFLQNEAM